MTHCHDMKLGQVYYCDDCGLKLKVIQECEDCGTESKECGCGSDCSFTCCGEPMKLMG